MLAENLFYNVADFKRIEQRKSQQFTDDIRTPFQHDRDRVLHSEPFRRLQNKTQVLIPGQYDFYRTRLTHSIEVGQIGRTIAYFLNHKADFLLKHNYKIDYDLIEAICMAHDIGHPPFGHLGEKVLNAIMNGPSNKDTLPKFLFTQFADLFNDVKKEVTAYNDSGFEANAQNLRIVENLAFSMGKQGRVGFNPTFATWEALLKYHLSASQLNGLLKDQKNLEIKFIYDSTYRSYSEQQKIFFNAPFELYERFNFSSLENQIMEMADDIAYSILDIEDAFKSHFMGLHNMDEIKLFIQNFCNQESSDIPTVDGIRLDEAFAIYLKDKIQIRLFKNKFLTLFISSLEMIPTESFLKFSKCAYQSPRFDNLLVFKYAKLNLMVKLFKALVKYFVYTTPHIKQIQNSYPLYIINMFQAYYYNPDLLPRENQSYLPSALTEEKREKYNNMGLEVWSKARIICDHISGMTDKYFIKQYKKMFDADEQHLLDIM
jgi:dGTPase